MVKEHRRGIERDFLAELSRNGGGDGKGKGADAVDATVPLKRCPKGRTFEKKKT